MNDNETIGPDPEFRPANEPWPQDPLSKASDRMNEGITKVHIGLDLNTRDIGRLKELLGILEKHTRRSFF